ncbi:MAG TPA: amidohydrolase family protein [Flavitalea sp.]|nr:amidohydrolase family protein [Flavitalea sp.]
MRIDSHVHFWKYDRTRLDWIDNSMKVLQKDYLPSELSGTLNRNDVDGVIAVQAEQSEVETLFLVELAKSYPLIKGVVAWVDLRAANVAERLDYMSQFTIIKGYRHIVQTEPAGFMDDQSFRNGIAALAAFDLSYDILIYPNQLQEAARLVQAFPGQRFVIDHCAKPDIKQPLNAEWVKGMEQMAEYPNVQCKLSGLFTEAKWKSWSAGDFYPFLDVVFKAFGTDRLMFGTDWPVILLSGMYVQWKSLLEKYMENLVPEIKDQVFGLNAAAFYKI